MRYLRTYKKIESSRSQELQKIEIGDYVKIKELDINLMLDYDYSILKRLIEDDFVLPKILLCREMTMKYGGLLSLYATHFHEFGHHFAIKQCGDRSEEAADKYGYKLIEENLPYFFKLFPYINYTHRLKTAELTIRETLRAYWQYWQYLRIKNKK